MQTLNSSILIFILLLSGCATSMKMTPAELKNLAPNEGVVVGSLIVKGGKDLLGRVKWELVAENLNNSGMFSKTFSITANRDEGEEIFASKLPAGDYSFSELRQPGFSSFKAKTNLRFTVQPNKSVYIGRIVIEFPPGLISIVTKLRIKVDDAKEDIMDKARNLYGINLNNAVSATAFGGSLADKVYEACLEKEIIKIREKKKKENPKLVAHYLCVFYKRTCSDKPESDSCKNAVRDYGVGQ